MDLENNINNMTQEKRNEYDDLAVFVGEKKEHYYIPRFKQFIESESKVGWNWPAFFVPVYWLLYRKMYLHVVILYCLYIVIGVLSIFVSYAGVLEFVLVFGMPLFANYIYLNHARKKIASCDGILSQEESMEKIKKLGGTNALIVIILLLISVAAICLAWSVIINLLLSGISV